MISAIVSFDMHVLQLLYAIREPYGVLVNIWISELGEWYVIGGLALALALWFAMRERFALAQGFLLAFFSGAVAATLLKILVARARPPEEFRAIVESGHSFPSAHAVLSLAFFGFVAWAIWRSGLSRSVRILSVTILYLLILAIGFSRLYLGVHYFSDVLGGYIVGALCLWLAIWATKTLEQRSIS